MAISHEGNRLTFPLTQPSGSLADETIVAALRRTCLWSHFNAGDSESRKTSHILGSSIASLPQMSTGQSQLFAVARAILQLQTVNRASSPTAAQPHGGRTMPILLLDEATSSLDPETESAVRSIIREEFTEKGHTVIAITHRLSGMTGSLRSGQDIVVLLSKGRVEKIGGVEDVIDMTALQR
jgi:ATP-binding cassette, subfamily C (CFTR/MRP), member 1